MIVVVSVPVWHAHLRTLLGCLCPFCLERLFVSGHRLLYYLWNCCCCCCAAVDAKAVVILMTMMVVAVVAFCVV